MLDRLRLLRYESPITLLAIILVTIFVIGGIIFGAYKIFFDGGALPTVGGNVEYEDVKETTITKSTVKTPNTFEGIPFTDEELREANAAMSDEGAYEGGFDETVIPDKEDLYMEGAAVDPYVNEEDAINGVGVFGAKSESETKKEILSKMDRVSDDEWLGRELSAVEKSVLAKIKADPKNCYPEFDSVEYFNDVKNGADYYAGYSNFITIVLMCDGDVRNYDAGVY